MRETAEPPLEGQQSSATGNPTETYSQQTGPKSGCTKDLATHRKRQSPIGLPRTLRMEMAQFAGKLKRDHRALFASNPAYRKRAGQFLTALLPPKPRRRGRPGRPDVTQAIRLLRLFKHRCPTNSPLNIGLGCTLPSFPPTATWIPWSNGMRGSG
jgi:hypothetical protein